MGQILRLCGVFFAGLAAVPAAQFDPTAPPRTAPAAKAQSVSTLAWVRVNGMDSIAWYNGALVKLGDQVEGGRVVAIREDQIVIAGKGGRRVIPMLDPQAQHAPVAFPRSPGRK